MQTEVILPWQKMIWASLLQRKKQNRLPHALLFTGSDGIGKKELAHHFANYLLCGVPTEEGACGHCQSCCLQRAKTHPDFMQIELEENAQFIKIDQIRDVVSFVNSTVMLNGYRVILINPASAMNVYASNALLKTLEEPTPNTLIMLICNQRLRLPPTISSRCQVIAFQKPDQDISLAWLASEIKDSDMETVLFGLNLADGAPIQARDFLLNDTIVLRHDLYNGLVQLNAQQLDPLKFAEKWEDKDIRMVFNLLLVWLRDLLRFKLTASKAYLINSDYYAAISQLSKKFAQDNLIDYCDVVQKIYAYVLNSFNINRPLLLKEVFIRWMKLC